MRALLKMNPSVKILAVSGLAENSTRVDLAGTDAVTFLQKPYTTEELLTTLHRKLSAAPTF